MGWVFVLGVLTYLAVVLEANSHFSVLRRADKPQYLTLTNVSRSTSLEI